MAIPWLAAKYSGGDLRRGAYWSGGYTQTDYDAIGRPTWVTAPNGEQQQYNYAGRAMSIVGFGRNGDNTEILKWQESDGLGNLKTVRTWYWGWNGATYTWLVDGQVTLSHDVLGNLVTVSHPNSIGTTSIGYDLGGRKTSMNDPDLGYWSYGYDRQGKLTRQTDARDKTICLYYDSLGRLDGKYFQSTTACSASLPAWVYSVDYGYDAGHSSTNRSRGQLTRVGYGDGTYSKALVYNSQGLPAQESVTISGAPQSYTTLHLYDSSLRPWRTTYADGENVTVAYNSMGLPNQLLSGFSGTLVDSVSYDEAGRLRTLRFPLGGNLWQSYGYYPWSTTDPYSRSISDSNGRLRLVYVGTNPYWGDKYGSHYSYDSHGNVTVFEESLNNASVTSASFTYDYQNRLTNGYGRSYTYDAAGRMTNYEGAAQSFHPYRPHAMAPNWSQYAVDLNGNFTARVQNGVAQTLTWDHENRLSSVTGAGVNDSFLYDPDGQRVKKTSNGVTTYYPNQFYETYAGNVDKYYYFNGQPIALRRNGTIYYLHQDQLGNLALVTSGGASVNDQGFYAYGKLRRGSIGVERSFTGQQKDFSSGLIYFDARYYDPELGQFISPDTIVPDPGNLFDYNRYMYGRGNPMKYTDPTGHCTTLDDGSPDMEHDGGCWDAAKEWLATFGLVGYEKKEDWHKYFASSPSITEDTLRPLLFNHWAPLYREWGVYHERYNPPPQMHPVTSQDQAFERFHSQYAPDCNEIDCVTHSLDALATGAALVGVGCAAITWGTCGLAATAVGGITGVAGVAWTAYQVNEGNSTEVDLVVTGTTLTIGAAKEGNPWVALGASLFQWAWDYRNPMADK